MRVPGRYHQPPQDPKPGDRAQHLPRFSERPSLQTLSRPAPPRSASWADPTEWVSSPPTRSDRNILGRKAAILDLQDSGNAAVGEPSVNVSANRFRHILPKPSNPPPPPIRPVPICSGGCAAKGGCAFYQVLGGFDHIWTVRPNADACRPNFAWLRPKVESCRQTSRRSR